MNPISRRQWLSAALTTAGMAVLAPYRVLHAGLFDSFLGGSGAGREITPLTRNQDFYITSIDVTPNIQLDEWALSIQGMVEKPVKFQYQDLLKVPHRTMIATLECIGNPVGGESIGTAEWEGIPLHVLLEQAGISPDGVDLVMQAKDGYSDSISLARARETDVMLALKMNGVPLPPDHGYPARIIVPGLYGIKNVKWLTRLEVVNYDYKGHWQREGWPEEAPIKPMSRIDQPGDGQAIIGPSFNIRGIAFAGRSGVRTVEVGVDEGKTWAVASIEPRLSQYAWILWNYEWRVPAQGEQVLMVRATDEEGKTQSTKPGDLHAVTVNVISK